MTDDKKGGGGAGPCTREELLWEIGEDAIHIIAEHGYALVPVDEVTFRDNWVAVHVEAERKRCADIVRGFKFDKLLGSARMTQNHRLEQAAQAIEDKPCR